MDERIYRDNLVARFTPGDDGSGDVSIESGRVSAAGELMVELVDGLILRLDFARPEILIGIDVEIPAPPTPDKSWTIPSSIIPMLASLIGYEATNQILKMVSSGADRTEEVMNSSRREQRDDRWGGQAEALGEAVHLLDIANDPEELLGVRVVAAFESVRYGSEIWHDLIEDEIGRLAIDAIEKIRITDSMDDSGLTDLDSDLRELMSIDVKIAMLSAEVVSGWKRSLPIELENLRTRVLGLLESRPLTREPRRHRRPEVDEQAHTSPSLGTLTRVECVSPGRLRATWNGRPRGKFARVLDRRDQSILAVAPVVEVEGGSFIEAVIPVTMDVGDVVVIGTDTPFPIAAASEIESVFEACQLGQKAVRLSLDDRVDRGRVAEAWQECRMAWETLGDIRRAKEAVVQMSYRRGSRRTPFAAYVRTVLVGHEFD
jgi:hypothetical protein